ncbi:unnamed protein product [Pelagomonas calceolata]|uniref:Plastid light harvesting protein n=1 Tax=Pelagomonas calceolata TaxID=35677 RepID=A0A8J2SY82_9STRA|nr:unnamed protein product [Pelagomonas calceolata]
MQRIIAALALSGASAFVAPVAKTSAVARASDATETAAPAKTGFTYADLKAHQKHAQALAKEQNPIVGYFDPLELGDKDFWEQGNEATIGFLREAEIKHGRVAMAGFVGYLVHAKGITWGFPMTMQGDKWPELGDGGVAALWDNLKAGGKWQIIGFVGCLEFWRELQTYETAGKRDAHYMRGGLPGKYPDFEGPLPNLYWGLGAGKKTPEQLAKGRNAEINNGRLAMLGLFGFFAESKAPGSVPFLTQFDFPAYGGDFMQPFEGNFELFGGN